MASEAYTAYLARCEDLSRGHGGPRKRLDEEKFEELHAEYERLAARMDPADIQLDEWKRGEELKFLLILGEDEEE